jgi:hypothetical protein
MSIHPDFEDLLRLLEEYDVEYMIVGGYAVAYHGHPRQAFWSWPASSADGRSEHDFRP